MYTFYLAMNKAKWDSLPKDIQKIFTDVSNEYAEKYAETWNQIDIDGIKYSLSIPGNEVFTLSEAEGKRFKDAAQPVISKYVDNMVAKGYKKADVQGWIDYIKSCIEYWRAQEKQKGIKGPFDVNLPQG